MRLFLVLGCILAVSCTPQKTNGTTTTSNIPKSIRFGYFQYFKNQGIVQGNYRIGYSKSYKFNYGIKRDLTVARLLPKVMPFLNEMEDEYALIRVQRIVDLGVDTLPHTPFTPEYLTALVDKPGLQPIESTTLIFDFDGKIHTCCYNEVKDIPDMKEKFIRIFTEVVENLRYAVQVSVEK